VGHAPLAQPSMLLLNSPGRGIALNPESDTTQITGLLRALPTDDGAALERLFPIVYEELRRVARRQLRRVASGHTLSTTALVHEAYMRLLGGMPATLNDRAHFLAVAGRAMRQVLTEYARRHQAAKRGGGWQRVELDESRIAVDAQADTLIALDTALARLAVMDARLSRVVECRFFGGMTEDETATALSVTSRTVRRDWVKARLWLYNELHGDGASLTGTTPVP
jgi:RNA polymerase sigma factor (TIGR02999 family)